CFVTIRGKTEPAQFLPVQVQPPKTVLDISHRNPAWRQYAPIVLRVLVDDLPRTLPPETGEITNIHRVASAFVIQVAQNGRTKSGPGIVQGRVVELASDREVEGRIAGEIPACAARFLGLLRQARAVGAVLGTMQLILAGGDDFIF